MKRKYLILLTTFIILCCCLFSGCNSLISNNKKQSTVSTNLSKESDQQSMMNTIRSLASSNRQTGSNNEKKACKYTEDKIKSHGYSTHVQAFSSYLLSKTENGKLNTSQNLIAVKKSKKVQNKGVIIICAHYDSTKDSVGANDNASGVSVVLETARLLKNVSSDYELKFIFFGSEEVGGGLGSRHYINELTPDDKKNIKAVINIDSIAQKGDNKPQIFTINGKKNFAVTLLKTKPKDMNVKKAYKEFSDYYIFDENKIPSLCIGQSYDKNLKINGPQDTFSIIDESKLKLVADTIVSSLSSN